MHSSALASPEELLRVADAVARDKGLNPDEVVHTIEVGIQKAARTKYGGEYDIRARIDRTANEVALQRFTEVVADDAVEDDYKQIGVTRAKKQDSSLEVGAWIIEDLPLDFGRIIAQVSGQVMRQEIRRLERQQEYEEFKDREGEIVSGVIKRADFGNYSLDLGGRAEGFLRRDEIIPRENLRQGDRVRAYIYRVQEGPGPQVLLSRTHPQFLAKLFTQEVPEIYEGIIEIKAVARDPGSRAKIAVLSHDHSIDPVGACVGLRGARVQAVVGELQGEKIDIIPWVDEVGVLTVNALQPATVSKVVVDEDSNRIEVVVPEDQLSLAIGRRGQNVRLASILTGWDIDLLTEAEEAERRSTEFKTRTERFIEALDVEEVIAQLLVAEGFTSIEDVAYVPINDLVRIEGFDESVAEELQNRAKTWLETKARDFDDKVKKYKIAQDLLDIEGLSNDMILALGENDVKNRDDLADLAGDELREIVGEDKLTEYAANDIIMAARAHWFTEEDESESEDAVETAKEA